MLCTAAMAASDDEDRGYSERWGGKEGKRGMVALCACIHCQGRWCGGRVKKDGSCFLSLLLVAVGSDGWRRGEGDADCLVDVAVEMGWGRERTLRRYLSLSPSLGGRRRPTSLPWAPRAAGRRRAHLHFGIYSQRQKGRRLIFKKNCLQNHAFILATPKLFIANGLKSLFRPPLP